MHGAILVMGVNMSIENFIMQREGRPVFSQKGDPLLNKRITSLHERYARNGFGETLSGRPYFNRSATISATSLI